MLTIEKLKKILEYDPDTGIFTRRVARGRCRVGSVAGTLSKRGYWHILIDGEMHLGHRLAWFYVHGRWPVGQIDHKNLKKSDNRIKNLREASPSENNANTRVTRRNTSGFKGVTWNRKCQKWQASIKTGRRNIHLGLFGTPQVAHAAYQTAAKAIYGNFARTA